MNGSKNLLGQVYDAGSTVAWVAGAVFGLVTLYLLVNITINGPKLRAAADAALAQTIDQENDAFCQKYGMLPRTEAYQNCKIDSDRYPAQGVRALGRRYRILLVEHIPWDSAITNRFGI